MSRAITEIRPVLEFLRCRTPNAWLDQAAVDVKTLLLDHAALELKAAQQAQKLIWKYASTSGRDALAVPEAARRRLLHAMSRLAREELRHFEKVVSQLETRGYHYETLTASRYASGLHAQVRREEPGRLIDTLIVGAIIEARSCERFYSLLPQLLTRDAALAKFYESLLRSEARHFNDYLGLALEIGRAEATDRSIELLAAEALLVESPDSEFRFHSGVPASAL